MSEMVERVKKAIEAKAEYEDFGYYDDDRDYRVDNWDEIARAAIAAMREPTIEMRRAGVESDDKRTGNETCAHIYQAMIDAALKD